MATQGDMKTRIAQELRRDDLTAEIANAITTAMQFYKFERFNSFNQTSLQAFPASDAEVNNPWMNDAEELIRNRAKALLYAGVGKNADLAKIFLDLSEGTRAQLKLSTTFQSIAGLTAGTQGYMKAKIANEIERGDLSAEIAFAIGTAMNDYKNERFYFNETRDITFSTVANRYIYTQADDTDLSRLVKIDYIFAYIGGQPYRLFDIRPEIMEWSHLTTPASDPVGQPFRFLWYAQQLFIYPTSDQAYPLRIAGELTPLTPPDDVTTGNIWMTDAEAMIRARAKFHLYSNITAIKDPEKAAEQAMLAEQAKQPLRNRSSDLDQIGEYYVEPWGY